MKITLKNKLHLFNIVVFVMLNSVYLAIELYKFRLRDRITSEAIGDVKQIILSLNKLSMMTTRIEYLMGACTLIFLVISIMIDKRNKQECQCLKLFLCMNVVLMVAIGGISFLLARIYSVTIGNMLQQLIMPALFIAIGSLYLFVELIVSMIKRKISH